LSLEALLAELRSLDIRLWTEDGRLMFSAPRGALTEPLRESIRLHKPELLGLLGGTPARDSAHGSAGASAARPPLSYAQLRMWFLAQLEPESATYNIPVALALEGPLQVSLMEAALNRIVSRHEVLRTTFVLEADQPVQQVHAALPLHIETASLDSVSPDAREARARQLLEQEALRPFDLERGPLLRGVLLRLEDSRHVLLLNLHHIAGDGWSMAILNRELSVCYNALMRGEEPVLPALPRQYADYACWQREQLQGAELQRLLDYWKSRLEGVEELALPADRPRPASPSGHGGRVRVAVPRASWSALQALCLRKRVTPFMLLLAAFSVLLQRYCGQDDIAVGTPIAGRQLADFEALIGFFVNTLVMRTDLSGDPTFGELLQRVRDTALDAYDHQGLPFEKLVEELAPAREGGRNPLFQVMFALQNVPQSPLELEGLTVARFPLDLHHEKFDLSLTMHADGDDLVGAFSYSADLFERATVEAMAACFVRLLGSIAAGPGQPVHALCLLGDSETQAVLRDWNDTARDFGGDACVHALIERQAASDPGRTAVVCGGQRLSYAELNARANRLAHYLRAQGVGADRLVGLCLYPSLDTAVAILAVLKAGGAYLPLDPVYPAERLAYMLEDSGATLVLCDHELPFTASAAGLRCVRLDRDAAAFASCPADNPSAVASAASLAYVIYTSGTTGKPKGVLVEHRSVANLARALRERLELDRFARPLRNCLSASISFDASVDNWVMLGFGDELHVLTEETRRDAAALLRYVREQRIDVLDSSPQQLALLVEEGLLDATWVPPVITVGGEAVDPRLWSRLAGDPRAAVWNLYGPTECTVEVLVARIGVDAAMPVIGRPLANARVYLLDEHGQPVPPGAVGEICIGGAALARGYHRRPELTAERFVTRTLPGEAPQRLYRTGDFGRFLPDGTVMFLGRRDEQVKLRGYRIELGEIDAVISAMPGVRAAKTLLREDEPGRPALVAYVRIDEGEVPGVDAVRQWAQVRLPAHMVPSAVVFVGHFPLTPSGKIERKALPAPDLANRGLASGPALPETALQRQLAAIWSAFIPVADIGIDEDFFALGGHSLLATRVINRINRDCGVDLALRVMFEEPTIRRLAAAIERLVQAGGATAAAATPAITAQPRIARKRPQPGE